MAYSKDEVRQPRQKVVITGMGMITPMGLGCAANADGFRDGRVAIRDVTLFDTERQRAHRAGELDLPAELPETHFTERQAAGLDRASALVVHAAAEALNQAGYPDVMRSPLVFGSSAGAMKLGEDYYRQATSDPANFSGQVRRARHYPMEQQVLNLCRAYELSGPISLISNACASGANALGQAFRLVQSGRAERVVCGGYDALSHLVFAGFDSLQALSPTVARPFDAARDGLALGEGAAVFVVESAAAAETRGGSPLAEVVGYGSTTDLHHLTQPHPEGIAAVETMTAACAEAGWTPGDIDYINSHGTGTPLNDVAEGHAIRKWAGDVAASVKVSSTKGAIGHLLGGAGAVEAAICVLAMRGGWAPPSVNVRERDPVCTFDLITEPREASLERVLTNSFGFGGANATVALARA